MRDELETYYQIDRYLNNELHGEELWAFEKKIKDNTEFAEEVEHQKLIHEVVRGAHFDTLRTKMQSDIKALDKGQSTWKWWVGGFAGMLLLGSGLYTFVKPELKKSESIAAETSVKESPEVIQNSPEKKETGESKAARKQSVLSEKQPDVLNKKEEVITDPSEAQEIKSPEEPVIIKEKDPANNPNPFYNAPNETPLKVNCNEVRISATPVVQPTCKGEPEGSIIIYSDHIKGGIAPYKVAIDESSFQQKREVFAGLEAGKHILTIKDQSGCVSTQEIIVPEKNCQKLNTFAFQPELGETWKAPVADSESGTLSIFNGSGMLVHKTSFTGATEWNGTDMHGNLLTAGTYVFILEYTNGKKENGQISINR